MLFIIAFINLGYIAWCCYKGLVYLCARKENRSKANGIDPQQHGNNNESPIGNGTTKESALPIPTPERDLSFGTVTFISAVFYCSLFIILALLSSYFCSFVVYATNNVPTPATISLFLVSLFLAVFTLNIWCQRFRALSKFTTYLLLALSTITCVLLCCDSFASYSYYEMRT